MGKWNLPPPEDDGLKKSEAKAHSLQKHYFLRRYIDAFTTAMGPKRWDSLHYIDLFAGAGIVILDTGELVWGSPLIAAKSPVPFHRLHLCERNRAEYGALKARVDRLGLGASAQLLFGDANEQVGRVVKELPAGSLSFAFLDPYGLHLNYSTIEVLSKARCDLLIFFPDRVDLLRNWKLNYKEDPNSNPDQVFGSGADWRSIFDKRPRSSWVRELTRLYMDQLRKLGYGYVIPERIYTKNNSPLYQLLFCSKHKAGERIWRGISSTKPDKQRTFDFQD